MFEVVLELLSLALVGVGKEVELSRRGDSLADGMALAPEDLPKLLRFLRARAP